MDQAESLHLAMICLLLAAAIGLGLSLATEATRPDQRWQVRAEKRLVKAAAIAVLTIVGIFAMGWWTDPVLATMLQPVTPIFH